MQTKTKLEKCFWCVFLFMKSFDFWFIAFFVLNIADLSEKIKTHLDRTVHNYILPVLSSKR